METTSINKTVEVIWQEGSGICSRGQNKKCQFVRPRFTGRMDFTVFWYSVSNSGLLDNSWFCFQGNLVKVNHIRESMHSVFSLVLFGRRVSKPIVIVMRKSSNKLSRF
jgi:hypothetical protein